MERCCWYAARSVAAPPEDDGSRNDSQPTHLLSGDRGLGRRDCLDGSAAVGLAAGHPRAFGACRGRGGATGAKMIGAARAAATSAVLRIFILSHRKPLP